MHRFSCLGLNLRHAFQEIRQSVLEARHMDIALVVAHKCLDFLDTTVISVLEIFYIHLGLTKIQTNSTEWSGWAIEHVFGFT